MREFEGGATRDGDEGKLDFEGFLSPEALIAYAKYMHRHRNTALGVRASDNWQAGAGMPVEVYMKSAWRHLIDWWGLHRQMVRGTPPSMAMLEESICGVLFNAFGYLHQLRGAVRSVIESNPEPMPNVPQTGGDPRIGTREHHGQMGAVGPRDRDYIGPGSGAREG